MAVKQPIRLQPKPTGLARVLQPRNVPTLALAAIALALAILIFHDLFTPTNSNLSGLRTASVTTATVTNTVSSSGSLIPSRQLGLGFKTSGTLTEVDVLSGATVKAGQVLARIDTAPLQLALQQAQASLAAASAALTNTSSGTSLQQAQDALSQAQQAYSNAVNNLNADQATLTGDTNQLNLDKAAYAYTQYAAQYQTYQANLTTAQGQYALDNCLGNTPAAGCSTDQANIVAAQNGIACLQAGQVAPPASCTFAQLQMFQAYRAANGAQGAVNADQLKVNSDNNAVQQTSNAVTTAQDNYNTQSVNRPSTLATQAAQVAAAQSQVNTAQANLDASTLTAPVDGVITSVTNQVGGTVSAFTGGAGEEAPGSTALLPTSGTGSGASSSFMTEISTASYQTVVSFAESDAAKIAAGQVGQVTFDAISGLTVPVHVLAVAGAATVVSNVVNYYVTLALDSSDPRLRPGLTTNAVVVTAEADNVLTVPNSAITRRGTSASVTILQGANKVVTPVTLGVVGATSTEIKSGVKEGDTVVLPTVTSNSAAGNIRSGGGGGRFVGGGLGG